jgi:hypothetical protein
MDYLFEILDNGNIIMDPDLTLEKFNSQIDTEYVLKVFGNRIVFVKKII